MTGDTAMTGNTDRTGNTDNTDNTDRTDRTGDADNTGSTDAAGWGLTEADDRLHPFPPDEPLWTETVWFSWMVPERHLLGYVYPVFRPNLGVQFGGVTVYDASAHLPWELPVRHWQQHIPLPELPDLRDARLADGITLRAARPGHTYDIGYASDELTLDLRYEALMRPLVSGGESDLFAQGGHLDQPGRVTGTMVLHGEPIAVDCFAIRDRAWGPRRDQRQRRVGYAYGTASATEAFLALSGQDRQGTDRVWTGYLMRDGVWSPLVAGERQVGRDSEGRPATVRITGRDELGRALSATGTVVSRMVFTPYPSMFAWCSMTRWDLDGTPCWGEDQDVWSPRRWRRDMVDAPAATPAEPG